MIDYLSQEFTDGQLEEDQIKTALKVGDYNTNN